MLELLRAVLLTPGGDHKKIDIPFEKTITVGDIITLDRVVSKYVHSVVDLVMRIDPEEKATDSQKLRLVIFHMEENARLAYRNGPIEKGSLLRLFAAPFRQRPIPKLFSEAKVKKRVVTAGTSESSMGAVEIQIASNSVFVFILFFIFASSLHHSQ